MQSIAILVALGGVPGADQWGPDCDMDRKRQLTLSLNSGIPTSHLLIRNHWPKDQHTN